MDQGKFVEDSHLKKGYGLLKLLTRPQKTFYELTCEVSVTNHLRTVADTFHFLCTRQHC